MNKSDLDMLTEIKESLDKPAVVENAAVAIIENPAREVEKSLVSILKFRTEKLQSSFDYEELVKASIAARINEASFPQLLSALEIFQEGNSRAVEGLINPFLANPAFAEHMSSRGSGGAETAAAEVYSKTDDHRVLQGLVALNQLLDIIKNKQGANATTVTAEVVPSPDQSADSTS